MMRTAIFHVLLVVLSCGWTGCDGKNNEPAAPAPSVRVNAPVNTTPALNATPASKDAPAANAVSASKATPASGTSPTSTVARIVFIDQKEACACTRKRIEESWKVMMEVLGFPPAIDVERIHMDSQKAQAETYEKMKPVMVIPGIYFLDKQGKLMTLLQGEVGAQQIKQALNAPHT